MTPGGMRGPTTGLSQQAGRSWGSLILEAQGRVGAAPTTTRRVGTARRLGLGKQGGKVQHDVNQWSNPLKRLPRLQPGGYGPASSARTPNGWVGDSVVGVASAGPEATRKGCGVLVARLQGNSWAPPPPTGAW
jgi:hypothetical protein